MGFDWCGFLELATHLNENAKESPNNEAAYRSAVSRAYYAAFHRANEYIESMEGRKYDGGGAHYDVRMYFKTSGNDLKRRIGNQLERIHKNRIKADYRKTIAREKPMPLAGKTIAVARKILENIKQIEEK